MIVFGQPRRHFAQCGSTNDAAREWGIDPDDPAPSGALVTSDFQTKGRGRRGRQWQAGFRQSALMSFVYRPVLELPQVSQLGLMTALAVADALDAQIKWPNDILLKGHKVAGILVETAGPVVIVGVGVNVRQTRFVGLASFAYPPTSLSLARGQATEVETVIEAVAQSLAQWVNSWQRDGFARIVTESQKRLAVGAAVKRGEEQGELVGLNADGSALVRLPDGTFTAWVTVD